MDSSIEYLITKVEIYKSDIDFLIQQIKEGYANSATRKKTNYVEAYAILAGTVEYAITRLEKLAGNVKERK